MGFIDTLRKHSKCFSKYQLITSLNIFRTYLPSQVPRIVELWRTELGKVSEKAGQSLADPKEYSNLFPDYAASLKAEQMLKKERSTVIPAKDYMEILVRFKPLNFLSGTTFMN